MRPIVWLSAATMIYPEAGGHLWVYLNWALGLHSLGCRVVWLEACDPALPVGRLRELIAALKSRLAPYGLEGAVALCSLTTEPLSRDVVADCVDLQTAAEADLLLNLTYTECAIVLDRFRRTAMIDIDPGLLQVWMANRPWFSTRARAGSCPIGPGYFVSAMWTRLSVV